MVVVPLTKCLTFFKFGSQRVRVLMFEWLILLPEVGRLQQKSQTRAMVNHSFQVKVERRQNGTLTRAYLNLESDLNT